MFCPNCLAEYREGFTHCPDCDVELVSKLPEEPEHEEESKGEKAFVPILSTYNLADIALIKSILDNNGIEYFIKGENYSHLEAGVTPAIVMTIKDDAETVKELLKDLDIKFMLFNSS